MGVSTLRVRANCDQVLLAWKTDGFIAGCRGFALQRRHGNGGGNATEEFVHSWVGFKGQPHQPGEHEPTNKWPVQRFGWSDLLVNMGDEFSYRVIPMVRDADAVLKPAPESTWSKWSDPVTVCTGTTPGMEAYFNRGIVPGQFIARQKLDNFKNALDGDIKKPGSKNRDFLSGSLRPALLKLLADAKRNGDHIYAALYELNDPELIAALVALGKKCHLILANGAFEATGDDENAKVRRQIRAKVDLHDRIVPKGHFAHNKFVVFCDPTGDSAVGVWTGSTNWTVTGLCTQVNNGLYVKSDVLANEYKKRWEDIRAAKNAYPKSLIVNGSKAGLATLGSIKLKAWNVPCAKLVDLVDARKYLEKVQQGVLFLTFNPGPKNTLLNDIVALDHTKFLIHGVANQDPGGSKAPVLKLVERGKKLPPVALSEVIPAPLQHLDSKWFLDENRFAMVMIHSKVIVIDPFGANPVVMTGSHNLGPKASGKNDDNLLIIENAPALAAEYAIHIAFVFAHYKWRYNQWLKAKALATNGKKTTARKVSLTFDGIDDDDQWQHWYDSPDRKLETEFWAS